jgi:UDP-N-acetylmuramoylalanine--D-glutamate ligase
MTNWQGKTILVIGAARQGMAATRFLASHGSEVILTDIRPEQNFIDQTQQFQALPVRFVFGSHPSELLEKVDGICVSGGVPLDIPLIIQARKMNIPLTNDTQLFLDLAQAKVIGITGSAGKTTTTTLIGEIAKSGIFPGQKVWVGGNIGNPLIDQVEDMCSEDWVVMELSSFQLELIQTSPSIAVVLNITPNCQIEYSPVSEFHRLGNSQPRRTRIIQSEIFSGWENIHVRFEKAQRGSGWYFY